MWRGKAVRGRVRRELAGETRGRRAGKREGG